MGVQLLEYPNDFILKGWGFEWHFPTREEAEAKRKEAWQEHKANIDAFKIVADMLIGYRR